MPFCGLEQEACAEEVSQDKSGCLVPCRGLYADIQYTEDDFSISEDSTQGGIQLLADIFDKYKEHKNLLGKTLLFDPTSESFSKFSNRVF